MASEGGMSGELGVAIGGLVGGVGVTLLVLVLVILVMRRRQRRRAALEDLVVTPGNDSVKGELMVMVIDGD